MLWKDRQGNIVPGEKSQDKTIHFLYNTVLGRCIVSILVRPWVSHLAGKVMDAPISKIGIRPFIRSTGIPMKEYEDRKFRSFNDFFTRRVRDGLRPVDMEPSHLISPCDCKLSVYPITEGRTFVIKGSTYTLESLLRSKVLANQFAGGTFLQFRLTKEDYHRYCYPDNGIKGENTHIPGVLHTVNPIALEHIPVYKENTREYTVLQSANFGPILLMEVGATMVGRIVNYHGSQRVHRGEEKGRFEFGGSTLIACLQKDAVIIDADILENTAKGIETVVKYGERIGIKQ